jgi:hypothetical protein
MVEALRFKPEGRRFDYQCGHLRIFSAPKPSSRTMGPEFTQPVGEMSTGRFLEVSRGRRLWLKNEAPSVSQLSGQCGVLNISQTYRPPRPVTGIALHSLCCTYCVQCVLYCLCSFVCCFVCALCVILCDMCIFVCCVLLQYHCHRVKPHLQFN